MLEAAGRRMDRWVGDRMKRRLPFVHERRYGIRRTMKQGVLAAFLYLAAAVLFVTYWTAVLILALVLIAIGLIGTTYVAATIISQWVLVGQGPIVQGERFEITVNQTFTQFQLYRDYPFEIRVKNNDITQHSIHPYFKLNLTSGGDLGDEDFVLSCNGTNFEEVLDGGSYVEARVQSNWILEPGASVKYVCNLKFVSDALVGEEIKVEVALEGSS